MSSKLQLILTRKYIRRWSDLQFILMLEIAKAPSTFSELLDKAGGSHSGTWNALQQLRHNDELIELSALEGRNFYRLTDKGKLELATILS
jgi:hypothetical protein